MSIRGMVDDYIRRQREAAGERLVWLKPGTIVVGEQELAALKDIAQRVHYGELVVAPTLAKQVLALGTDGQGTDEPADTPAEDA